MIQRRLLFGFLIIVVLLIFCWLDVSISQYGLTREIIWLPRGIILLPSYMVCLVFLTREVLRILNAAGLRPLASTVYLGNLLIA
ncbi:MAG: hypothetical protein LBC02_01780, partial [Planctomycetaceae bacterium]|nr:hypothetical protein [Planctomycetaceae bacterium]